MTRLVYCVISTMAFKIIVCEEASLQHTGTATVCHTTCCQREDSETVQLVSASILWKMSVENVIHISIHLYAQNS